MPTTQTNGIDTATFERRPPATCTGDSGVETRLTPVIERETGVDESDGAPPVAGGQGRTARDVETTVDVLLLLAVVALFGVIVRVVGLLLIGG